MGLISFLGEIILGIDIASKHGRNIIISWNCNEEGRKPHLEGACDGTLCMTWCWKEINVSIFKPFT